MALPALLSKLVTVDHDNRWLHIFPYLEYCLVDTDRILLKGLTLVNLTVFTCFSVPRKSF